MKNRILILFFLLAVTGCGDKDLKEILYLTDGWQFSQNKEEGIWYKASVPGTIHTDLLNQGLIKDPFYGKMKKIFNGLERVTGITEKAFSLEETKSILKTSIWFLRDWILMPQFTLTGQRLVRAQICSENGNLIVPES
ncbi:hypothetical protein MASR2M69_03370 [Bacteroidota bacterium]